MADAFLPSTPSDGNMLALLLPEVADLRNITAAEANAAGVIDLSCYLTSDGYNPSLDEQVISDERLCDRVTREARGRSTRGLDLTYIDNTNAADAANINEAADTLTPGSKHVLFVRRGLPFEDEVVAGQTYSAYRIESGEQNELPPESNSVLKISQKQFVRDSAIRVKVAA